MSGGGTIWRSRRRSHDIAFVIRSTCQHAVDGSLFCYGTILSTILSTAEANSAHFFCSFMWHSMGGKRCFGNKFMRTWVAYAPAGILKTYSKFLW